MNEIDDDQLRYETRRNQWKENGRRLVEAGVYYEASQVEDFDIAVFWSDERDLLEWNGECSKCGPEELFHRECGDVVCRRTNRPCMRFELREILELYEGVFNECGN